MGNKKSFLKKPFTPKGKIVIMSWFHPTMAYGRLAQLGERQVRNLEVRGSIPLSSTIGRKSEPDHHSGDGFRSNQKALLTMTVGSAFLHASPEKP